MPDQRGDSIACVPAERHLDETSEEDLVRLARAGNQAAFAALWKANERYFFNLILRLVDDRESARDLQQELGLAMWRGLPRYRGDSKFSVWGHTIAYRLVMNEWDQRQHRPLPTDKVNDTAGRDETNEIAERKLYNSGLAQLPPRYRTAVFLADVQGLTHAEIAEVMGGSPEASRVRVHRARHALLAWLDGQQESGHD